MHKATTTVVIVKYKLSERMDAREERLAGRLDVGEAHEKESGPVREDEE